MFIHSFKAAALFSTVILGFNAARAVELPSTEVPKSMSVQLKDGDDGAAGLNLVDEAGFGMVRRGVYWSAVEKTKGVYDFKKYDALFAGSATAGRVISATLYANNPLYGGSTNAITDEASRQGFAAFAAATVAHFKGQRIIWEIWNEPNLGQFWRAPSNTAEIAREYTALVAAVMPAVRAVDPNAFVVAGSISCLWSASFTWFDAAVAAGLLKTGISGISVHPYGFKWPELAPATGYDVLKAKLAAAGQKDMPIVNTEVGYDLGTIQAGQGYSAAEALEVQGALLVRQQLVDLMNSIRYSNWYEFRESTTWGVVNGDFTKRPAFNAAKAFVTALRGYTFTNRVSTASDLDYVAKFTNVEGRVKLVAWTVSTMKDAPANRRPHPHAITIAVDAANAVDVIDLRGATQSLAAVNGSITLDVDGSPKFITLPPAPPAQPAIGARRADQTYFVGLSPDGDKPMFVSACDAGARATTDGRCTTSGRVAYALINDAVPGAKDQASGSRNTAALLAAAATKTTQVPAAAACANSREGGYADWYLPSVSELAVLQKSVITAGNYANFDLGNSFYWSSTESRPGAAYRERFSTATITDNNPKTSTFLVRCVRKE